MPSALQVDEVPQRMLSLWTPSKGAGELDMCWVIEESASMKPAVLTLNRTLGGGGGPSEIAQVRLCRHRFSQPAT
jgi:hypothetical protein